MTNLYKALIWLAIIALVILSFKKYKSYYTGLYRTFKHNFTRNLVLSIGLICLFIITYLYLEEENVISQNIFIVSFLGVYLIMYFILMWVEDKNFFGLIKYNWQYILILFLDLVGLLTVIFLHNKGKINQTLFEAYLMGILLIAIIVWLVSIRWKGKKIAKRLFTYDFDVKSFLPDELMDNATQVKNIDMQDFDPLSLGILYFSFAISLWTNLQTSDLSLTILIIILVSFLALIFLLAVYIAPIRIFLNTKAAPFVIPVTTFAAILGFLFGWVPAFVQTSGIFHNNKVYQSIIVYFGFTWMVTILVAMYKDIKSNPVHILFVVFLLFVAGMKFCRLDIIGFIAGLALLIISSLLYLVALGKLHPYGNPY